MSTETGATADLIVSVIIIRIIVLSETSKVFALKGKTGAGVSTV